MEKTKLEQDTATLATMGFRIKAVGEPVCDDDWMTAKEYAGSRQPIGVTRGNNGGFCVQHDQSNYYLEKIPVLEPPHDYNLLKSLSEELKDEIERLTNENAIIRQQSEQYRRNWLSLQDAIGEQCLGKALKWVKLAKKREAEGNDIDPAAYAEINERHEIEVVRPDITDDVITKEGVYKRRDGEIGILRHNYSAGERWWHFKGPRTDEHSTAEYFDLTYLAPLPPNGARLLNVKPGDKLPEKCWFCYLRQGYSQWLTWGVEASEKELDTAHLNFLYAEYIEPTPAIPEGFTPWSGGECAVDENETVTIFTRNGRNITNKACMFIWEWSDDTATDIIGYRVIPPAPWVPTPGMFVSVKNAIDRQWFVGKGLNGYAVIDIGEHYVEVEMDALSPWHDPPHFSTVVDAGFGKCKVEWAEGQEPVVTKVEVQS